MRMVIEPDDNRLPAVPEVAELELDGPQIDILRPATAQHSTRPAIGQLV